MQTARAVRSVTSTDVFTALLVLAVASKFVLAGFWTRPAVEAWRTVFAAICVQATPHLALGVLVSGVIAVFVPTRLIARILPGNPVAAVALAGVAGIALPGCECGSVPVSAALLRRGVRDGPAIAFLLAAPAINPVVVVATAMAFPARPAMVLARFLAVTRPRRG